MVANLARHIAQREAETAPHLLGWTADSFQLEAAHEAAGPGKVLMLQVGTEFGKLGVSPGCRFRTEAGTGHVSVQVER